jgi:hypothetical protein
MRKRIVLSAAALLLTSAGALVLTGVFPHRMSADPLPGYQAVLLDTNQVYYGRLTGLNSDYPALTDVFYVQTAVNPETKQASNILLKRGKEWHAPNKMLLSARHIVMIEPVTPGSTVDNLIHQAESK